MIKLDCNIKESLVQNPIFKGYIPWSFRRQCMKRATVSVFSPLKV